MLLAQCPLMLEQPVEFTSIIIHIIRAVATTVSNAWNMSICTDAASVRVMRHTASRYNIGTFGSVQLVGDQARRGLRFKGAHFSLHRSRSSFLEMWRR
jgi:hypothetical protein